MPSVVRDVRVRELLGGTVSVTTSYVFQREAFLVAGGCATFARSMDDYWALLNLSRICGLTAVDEPSVLYRIHPKSTTMSTAWSSHLLSSLVAARYGGNLVPLSAARDPRAVVPLDDDRRFWMHQLSALATSGSAGDLLDALALTRLLGCGPREQVGTAYRLSRSAAGAIARRHLASRRGSRP